MTLKAELLKRIEVESKPIFGGVLEQYAYTLGYKASNASRRLRDLVKEGKLTPSYERGAVKYEIATGVTKDTVGHEPIGSDALCVQYAEPERREEVVNETVQLRFGVAEGKS